VDSRRTRAALVIFRGLRLDLSPLVRLLADYTLSPRTRRDVSQVVDDTPADSALVEAVLVSGCQLTSWVVGSGIVGPLEDPHDQLLRAATQDGLELYVGLLRFMDDHWSAIRDRTGCQSLPSCLGSARGSTTRLSVPRKGESRSDSGSGKAWEHTVQCETCDARYQLIGAPRRFANSRPTNGRQSSA
jgi:hypothetical protein